MRIVLFMAVVLNSFDLVATAFGIHAFLNREGNPLLAPIVHDHWWLFVIVKGILTPLLIVLLHRSRSHAPVLAALGMGAVTLALTVAVGQWLGWIAGVLRVSGVIAL